MPDEQGMAAAINGIHRPDAVLLHGAGFARRISLLLDDRITHARTLSGEYGGAVQSRGRRNATDTHFLAVFARAIGRSGPPAVGAPNCTGGAVALAFAREGADVLISYLGSEEVDADEPVR